MGGGACEVLPRQKGGWGTKCFEVVLTWEIEVLAIAMEGGGAKSFHPVKGGTQKVLPCLEGGRKKFLDPRFSDFVAPLPIINDQLTQRHRHFKYLTQ